MTKCMIIAFLFLSGCSHKMIGKNCLYAQDPDANTTKLFICDSLNGMGQ